MNRAVIAGLAIISVLLVPMSLGFAGAQQYQGGMGMSNAQRTPVNGTYSNPDYGVTITLPQGWSGFEIKRTSGTTSVIAAPGGYHFMRGQHPAESMMINMVPKSVMPSIQLVPQRMMQNETCTNESASNRTVNGMGLSEVVMDCTGLFTSKSKYEVAQTSSSYVILGYRANSTSNYDSQVSAFDSAVGSLQVSGALQAPAVPEFPPSLVLLVTAVMIGSAIVLGRARQIPNAS